MRVIWFTYRFDYKHDFNGEYWGLYSISVFILSDLNKYDIKKKLFLNSIKPQMNVIVVGDIHSHN